MEKQQRFVMPAASHGPDGVVGNLPDASPDTAYFET